MAKNDARAHAAVTRVKPESQLRDAHDVAIVRKAERQPAPQRLSIALLIAVAAVCCALSLSFFQRTPAATVDTSSDAAIASFLDWFERSGGQRHSNISITQFPAMGRGVVAVEQVNENDRLLFVPIDLIICRETILKQYAKNPVVQPKLQKLATIPEELLTAFLVLQQLQNESSPWHPYLKLLPSFHSTKTWSSPLFFESKAEIEELQDERMIDAATRERHQAKLAFQRFHRLFKTVLPEVSTRPLPLEKSYLWARFLVNSRAFSINGERYLVPFGDVFNGQSQPATQRRAANNGAHFLLYHRLQRGVGMEILADRSTAPGAQIFEDYGDNDNYIYGLHHGFLMQDNAFDCAAVALPPLPAGSRHAITLGKRSILKSAGVQDDGSTLVCVTPRGRLASPSDQRLVHLYASLAEENDANVLALCAKREYESLCFSHAGRDQVNAVVRKAVEGQLASYATSIAQDEALLASEPPLSPALQFAVRFRLSRKQILAAALTHLPTQYPRPAEPLVTNDGEDGDAITRFQRWITQLQLPINHVTLQYVSPSMGYGAFATKPLANGEVYLAIPEHIVMDMHSAMRSPFIRQLLVATAAASWRWTESQLLLLQLLHEKFEAQASFWKPYLDTLPDHDRLASPLFYQSDSTQLELLDAAVPEDLGRLVHEYRRRVAGEYQQLLRANVLPEWASLERFHWATAILDSRSIWWGGKRHLVPLLDMVNCQELGDSHAPHATTLDQDNYNYNSAITRASWGFQAGEQIVENYAQPNYIYLLYHGFVLTRNSHDCAHFHFELAAARQLPAQDPARRAVIAMMEDLGFFSWSIDLCVGKRDQGMDKLLRVALIHASPEQAARSQGRQATQAHTDAATSETQRRLTTLQSALASHAASDATGPVLAYVQQQASKMEELLARLKELPVTKN